MCRLYGFRSNESTKVECSLVYAQNAMIAQSVRDARGEANADGWGIGVYTDGVPTVERSDSAAHTDRHFSLTAERVFARTVVAHVRGATVGEAGIDNTHPFRHGCWVFAHNGTVSGFDEIRERLDTAIDPDLLALRRGTTDSETAFLLLLTRMRRAGISLDSTTDRPDVLVEVLRETVGELDEICAGVCPDDPARLNFLVTDGHSLVCSCLRRSLFYVERCGIHDCEICGIPHIHHDERARYRAVVIASEPISHEVWTEVPDGSVISIDDDLRTDIRPIWISTTTRRG